MKKGLFKTAVLILIFALVCVPACSGCQSAPKDEVLTIVHATDMHFLSPKLTDYSQDFIDFLSRTDGKVTQYSPQICEAFVADMLEMKPDAVILSGDLTLNGAYESHSDLAAVLMPLKEAGIAVFVLPGNHDAGGAAYSFFGGSIDEFESVSDGDFPLLYSNFGYDFAISRDSASQSYVAELSPKLRLLFTDVNANDTAGKVRDETAAWAQEQLAAAKESGAAVISVSHQPLLTHNRFFTFGYTAIGGQKLLSLYDEFGVALNLCGHLHIQHIAKEGSLTEIAASSLAVSPNQYGVLTVRNGVPESYRTQSVNVSGWAAAAGETNSDLLDFAEFSAGFFDTVTENSVSAMVEECSATAAEKSSMTEFAVRLNAEYFAGSLTLTDADPAWALWQKYLPDNFFKVYMSSTLEKNEGDMREYNFGEQDK